MSGAVPISETQVDFRGWKVWTQTHGDLAAPANGRLPLLALHGGPGVPHDYLESLVKLAASGRPVIFYDQLGCGKSDRPDDPSLWTIDLFKEEIDVVRTALGLSQIHLLGQSWGGMLAMEYALTQPAGVASLIVASSPASMRIWVEEANRLREELPAEIQATLLRHESAGTTQDPDYQATMMAFYERHVCRITPMPDEVQRAFDGIGLQVYNTMNGPSEFHVVGTLKDWDIRDRLGEIRIPTLITSGRYDELTPMQGEIVNRGIPNSRWVIFEESSHMPHVEEETRYLAVLEDFLRRIEDPE